MALRDLQIEGCGAYLIGSPDLTITINAYFFYKIVNFIIPKNLRIFL